jgi:hypothetical protein
VPRLTGYSTAHWAPWLVGVGLPTEAASAGFTARFVRSLLFGLAAIAIASTIAWMLSGRIASAARSVLAPPRDHAYRQLRTPLAAGRAQVAAESDDRTMNGVQRKGDVVDEEAAHPRKPGTSSRRVDVGASSRWCHRSWRSRRVQE